MTFIRSRHALQRQSPGLWGRDVNAAPPHLLCSEKGTASVKYVGKKLKYLRHFTCMFLHCCILFGVTISMLIYFSVYTSLFFF